MNTPDVLVRSTSEKQLIPIKPDHEVDKDVRKRLDLWHVLVEIGAYPFTPESVTCYEELKKQEVNVGLEKDRARAKRSSRIARFACYVSIMLMFAPVLRAIFIEPLEFSIGHFMIVVLLGTTAIFSYSVATVIETKARYNIRNAWWQTVPLERYRGFVPQSVIELVEQIEKRLPEARCAVRVLAKRDLNDPFLLVEYGETSCAIAVWDEADFHRNPS